MKELIIKKSKFISVLYDINNIDDVKMIHISLKEKHKKAKHVVYGYILDQNTFGYNDDKEPQGSAGLPIVNLLKIKKQTNKAIFVIRYFGGTKLGKSNLLRTYLKVANMLFD